MNSIDPICGTNVDPETTEYVTDLHGVRHYFCSERCLREYVESKKIAYFSMEIGIANDIHTYSGGLGVLAGDTIRTGADLRIPLVAVTLVSRKGYLKQALTENGEQIGYPDEWDPSRFMRRLSETVDVRIHGRDVKIGGWHYEQQNPAGGMVPVIFLDTELDSNHPDDRTITDYLYGGDQEYRLKQEIVLGIGGIKMLDALDYRIRKYHMNEGHSSLLLLELLKKNNMSIENTREKCIFTTHTPVAAAFDIFPYNRVREMIGDTYPIDSIIDYAGPEGLNMTLLALNLSQYINGVTNAHMASSRKLFPGFHIRSITNGVYSNLWTSDHYKKVYDIHIPGWASEPELLVRAEGIPDVEIWTAHALCKKDLINYVNDKSGSNMDFDTLTIGFARRATAYKRATLLFSSIERLREVNRAGKIQLIFAGKAHPNDTVGKEMIKEIFNHKKELKDEIEIAYLENYDMNIAGLLTSGSDVWLGTPMVPYEASGTSGMKAALNGVINFSVLDGWWIEGCIEGITGWSIGPSPDEYLGEEDRRRRELKDLYSKLEYLIIPKFYENRDWWIDMMKSSISKVTYYFNTNRMMRRYATEAYL